MIDIESIIQWQLFDRELGFRTNLRDQIQRDEVVFVELLGGIEISLSGFLIVKPEIEGTHSSNIAESDLKEQSCQ